MKSKPKINLKFYSIFVFFQLNKGLVNFSTVEVTSLQNFTPLFPTKEALFFTKLLASHHRPFLLFPLSRQPSAAQLRVVLLFQLQS